MEIIILGEKNSNNYLKMEVKENNKNYPDNKTINHKNFLSDARKG